MSFRYQQSKYGQQGQYTQPDNLKEQVLQKVSIGLILAGLISTYIAFTGIPLIFYFLAIGLEIVTIIGYIFAKSEGTIEKLYYIFVSATAVTLGFMLQAFLALEGGMAMIATAFMTTAVIVGSIYYYTAVNKPDTSQMIKFLFPATIGLFIIFIVGIFLTFSKIVYLLLSIFGALLFSAYLYYDLGRLMNEQYRSPSRMAWGIYWDILLIFKFILQILFFSRD